ncbi:MAG TPA: hypothetical protein DCD97_03525 [Firmicutes bacterium]|nr:hypothetical protein [Bacillota bacterium]
MFLADFHIHSKYSRATSRECVPEMLAFWARRKGIGVVGTGDFTHPGWRRELKEKLIPSEEGLYVLREDLQKEDQVTGANFQPRFIVSGEISSIYKKKGRVRKVHNLILLPGLEEAAAIAHRLEAIGNLHSDGRPILGLDSRDLLEIVLDTCPEAVFIPAHIWTPHFSLFGAYSGFDDITECFEDLTGYIYAVETGLSSDPPMNWRLSALDGFTLVSNSDAHSPANLGREANIFDTALSYSCISRALQNRNTNEFRGTIEFFPEEGKYHYDGHRTCKICWKPSETNAADGKCPVCGGRITVGVLHRVEVLADREEGFVPPSAKHFESLIPLHEIIASSIGFSVSSKKVKERYEDLLRNLGTEFFILREAALSDIELAAGPYIAEGIRRLRCGQVEIQPGFDGEYGKIKIMDRHEIERFSGQLCLGVKQDFKESSGEKYGAGNKKRAEKRAAGRQLLPETFKKENMPPGRAKKVPIPETTSPPDENSAHITALSPSSSAPYGLNEEQWAAASCSNPAVAVIAGPGTGKTKTLISRIAYLVEECAVSPSQITAVTFTNKAANEMRLRLTKHFGDKHTAGAVNIGTFHSICLEILSGWEGRENITIIDEYHALTIIKELLKELKLKIPPRDALREISLLKNNSPQRAGSEKGDLPLPDLQKMTPRDARSVSKGARSASFDRLYAAYCSQLERYGLMDYDDILLTVLRGFRCRKGEETAQDGIRGSFSHLLVDEFQDINAVQYRLIKEWSKKSESIFIIGDPDQSIYGFRGSDFRFFEKFQDDFPGLRLIRLRQHYRSTPEIINCAQAVLSPKKSGNLAPSLETKRERGAKVRLITTGDELSEAVFVAKEINRMVGGIDMLDTQALSAPRKSRATAKHPIGFSEIAVLYRTNRQAEILEQCLSKEGIQYVVVGRDDFLAEQPVRETIAFLRFLLNPGDVASLLVCLQGRGIFTAGRQQKVLESYAASDRSLSSLIRIMETAVLPPQKENKLRVFIAMLRKYEPMVKQKKPGEIIASWINDNVLSGMRCMELLFDTSVMYEDTTSFIHNLLLGQESDIVRSGNRKYSSDAVSLMTIHSAKGLEFPVVFICGVNDGTIPLKKGRSGFHTYIDEERRLFYVGITRAQDELILLTGRTPSPFINDIRGIPEVQLETESRSALKQRAQYKQVSLFEI